MTFILAVAAAIMSAASLVLHAFGTKYPTAESLAQKVDEVESLAEPVLPKK